MKYREQVWNKLANEWKTAAFTATCNEIRLDELNEKIELMLEGKLKGRTVVKIQ